MLNGGISEYLTWLLHHNALIKLHSDLLMRPTCRLVTLAAGAAAGKFMQFEDGAPSVASQTAYGMEVEIEGYGEAYDESSMLFMDFRRHHTGVWSKAGNRSGLFTTYVL